MNVFFIIIKQNEWIIYILIINNCQIITCNNTI